MADRQHDFSADLQIHLVDQHVQGDGDRAFDGVFNRDDPKVQISRFHIDERFGDRPVRDQRGHVFLLAPALLHTKKTSRGLFRKGASRTQVSDGKQGFCILRCLIRLSIQPARTLKPDPACPYG